DQACFVWSMNAYNTPAGIYGKEDSDEFLRAEQSFFGMSHLHRTCLSVLNYSHSGNFSAGIALPLEGKGKEMKVKDWSAWDKRFGPMLDGTLFNGTPRA